MKKLRDSKLKDITVANDVVVKSEVPMSMFALSVKKKLGDKNEINLEDLLNFGRVSKAMTKEYETMKEDIDKINEELPENEKISSYNDYVKKLIDSTEFNYESQGEKELSIALDFIPYVNVGKWSYEIIFGEDPVSGKKLSTKERLFTLCTIGAGHLLGDIYKGIKAGIASGTENVAIDTAKEGIVLSINGVGSGRNIIQDAAKNVTEKILGKDSVKVAEDTIVDDGKNIAEGATDDITKVTEDSSDIINKKPKLEGNAEDLANNAENEASKVDEVKNENTDNKQIDNDSAVEGSGETVPIVNVSGDAKPSVKDGDIGSGKTSGQGIDGGSNRESTLEPKLEKYVQDSFEGIGKEAQDNFNKYLRENVWCDETLSNAEKIDIMKANFDKLTPEQKINFNVSNEVKVLKNPDYSDWGQWPDIDWPDFPGLNKDTVKSVYNKATGKIEIPNDLDRLGSPYGNNLGVVENGYHCTQDERSICYIENEYAKNGYKFNGAYYKDAIDAIKDFDIDNPTESIDKLNSVIKQNNALTGDSKEIFDSSNIDDIATVSDMKDSYDKFQNQCSDFCDANDIDSTYGLMGKADEWNINGETICTGGAGQINTPINVQSLERFGILKNNGGW